jgi:YggT family protein
MGAFIWLVDAVFSLAFWLIIASVVISWLYAFNIINAGNPHVRSISYSLRRLTDPILDPIRRILPDLGGLDLSPIVALLLIEFLRRLVIQFLVGMM